MIRAHPIYQIEYHHAFMPLKKNVINGQRYRIIVCITRTIRCHYGEIITGLCLIIRFCCQGNLAGAAINSE